jgi:hypothetical protein
VASDGLARPDLRILTSIPQLLEHGRRRPSRPRHHHARGPQAQTHRRHGSIRRGLATDTEDAAIVQAIIGLARRLGLRTLAEGVENGTGCEEFARPPPTVGVTRLW